MSNNLTPNNSTSYLGVRATTPPQMIVMKRAPTQNDYIGYVLGTQWLEYDPDAPGDATQYVLSSVAQNIAVWVPLNQGGDEPTLPDHSVVLGTGVPGFNSTSPNATLGQPLVSNGENANPSFGTASVSGGGTGLDAIPQYAVLTGGITGEGPLQTVSGLGTAGQVLTSNGNAVLPSWQNGGGGGGAGGPIAVQVFNSSGTYTPTVGMGSCIVELVGGGGGGGNLSSSTGGGGGGGAGGYSRKFFLAATIGASQAVVIGTGGASATAGIDSTFGAFLTSNGGDAGNIGPNGEGGLGGIATGGDIDIPGGAGGVGCDAVDAATTLVGISGFGGNSFYGAGAFGLSGSTGDFDGSDGEGYGAGGSGAVRNTVGDSDGGIGSDGICIVTEFGPYGILPPVTGTSINIIIFDTPGAATYTPTTGMDQVVVECIGGGGGAAYSIFAGSNALPVSGGGAGGYCKKLFDAATIGASQVFSVGGPGIGGATVGAAGTSGGTTTFGTGPTLLTATGGTNGQWMGLSSGTTIFLGIGGTATGGNININGESGSCPFPNGDGGGPKLYAQPPLNGKGGSTMYGSGGPAYSAFARTDVYPNTTWNATGYGAGGSSPGGDGSGITSRAIGGNGSSGVIIITEFIS